MTPQTKIRFTETDVNAIPFSAKRVRWHDNQMPGLVLDVTSKAKVFRVYKKLSGRRVPVSVTLGTFPALSVETARKLARKAMADMADGVNPNDSKRQFRAAAVTLQDVFQEYLEQRDLKPATLRGYHANMKLYIADWHNNKIEKLWHALYATITRNHRCKKMEELLEQVDHFMETVAPFPGGKHGLKTVYHN